MRLQLPTTSVLSARAPPIGAPPAAGALARRQLLALAAAISFPRPPAHASMATLENEQFAYSLAYPDDWVPAPKPVKTHLSEELLQSPIKGVSLGVTVDPVKINSLRQFGTAEQVAGRVLDTELTRDGVKDVLLRKVRAEDAEDPVYYIIEYQVESSRGRKVYLCKYCIYQNRLYVLQAQAKQDSFDAADAAVRETLAAAVASFRIRTTAGA